MNSRVQKCFIVLLSFATIVLNNLAERATLQGQFLSQQEQHCQEALSVQFLIGM